MSKTIVEMQSWLIQPNTNRVILVHLGGFLYVSNKPYVDNNINYNPCIVGGISYTEKLRIDGPADISFGTIELDNTNGHLDQYLTNIYWWKNGPVTIYLGDATWPIADFSLVFTGLIGDINVPSRDKLAFSITNKLSTINTSITDKLIGYTTSAVFAGYMGSGGSGAIGPTNITDYLAPGYATYTGPGTIGYPGAAVPILDTSLNTLRPILIGECFNITPVEIAASNPISYYCNGTLYMVHDGPIERIIEVRDNGAPVAYEAWEEWGMFSLENSSFGTITCSAQGYVGSHAGYTGTNGYIGSCGYTGSYGSYTDTIAGTIKILLKTYGNSNNLAKEEDFDFPKPDTTPYIGYYATEKENLMDVCNKIAQSGGYNLIRPIIDTSDVNVPSSPGKYKLIPLTLFNYLDVEKTITNQDFIANTITVTEIFPPVPAYKLNYNKNWTTQEKSTLAEALVPESLGYFTRDNLYRKYVSEGAQAGLNDYTEPEGQDIFLINGTHANEELNRQLHLRIRRRFIVRAEFLPSFLYSEIGDVVSFELTDTNIRFYDIINTWPTYLGRIVEIERNWFSGTVTIGILV